MKVSLKSLVVTLIIINIATFFFLLREVGNVKDGVNKLEKKIVPEDTSYIQTYNYILPKMEGYNPTVNKKTVKQIAKVMHHYNLDETKNLTNMYVGQILQESGANHFYKGKLLMSSGGAIGISQITATTAMNYITKILSDEDKKEMKSLGCSDFTSINSVSGLKSLENARTWLKNEKNNITMWGYIVRDMFKRSKDINKTLVAYNVGLGGLQTFLDSGNVITDHQYIVNIKNKLSLINGL